MTARNNAQPIAFADAVRVWREAIEAAGCPGRLEPESIPLVEASGRLPAQILRTKHPSPTYRAAAMDGFAVRAADIDGASDERPVRLRVGQDAIPIDTGGAMPDGFDSVVATERASLDGADVVVLAASAPGKNVRLPGEDVPPGVAVGWPGVALRPLDCAVLVASGCTTAEVVKRPRIAIVPTGDEVVPAGTAALPGTVIESNSLMVAAEARALGAEVDVRPIVRDDDDAIESVLRDAAASSDVVAILAGSSRGRRDRGASAIERVGTVDVRTVATRPARPIVLGHAGSVPIVNLPGYPVSCHFAFDAYVAPLLRRLGGTADPMPRRARLAEAIAGDGSADVWRPATLLTAPGSPRALVVPLNEFGGGLYQLASADARFHLKRGTSEFGRHAAVPWTPLRDADGAARSLFVGPYDPLLEEMAALGGFRCRWTADETGAALDEGLADAVGLIVRDGALAAVRKRAGEGRKLLPIGLRREGVAKRPGATVEGSRADAAPLSGDTDPWVGAAEVAAGIRASAPCSRFIAERFGISFEEGLPTMYVVIWEDRPGHRFPWGIVLSAALSALEGPAATLGWKSIGIPADAVP